MAKIRFETGQTVNFDGDPTPQDIEEVVLKLGIKSQPEQPGLIKELGGQLQQRGQNIMETTKDAGLIRTGVRTTGEVGFGLAEIAATPLKAAFRGIPEPVKKFGQFIAETPINKAVLGQAKEGFNYAGELAGEVAKKYPEATKDVKGVAGILTGLATVIPGFNALKNLGKSSGFGASLKSGQLTLKTPSLLPKQSMGAVDTAIDVGINKAVRPSVVGKQSSKQIKDFTDRSRTAVKSIVLNKNDIKLVDELGNPKPAGSLPATLSEFTDALGQRKQEVFKRYDALSGQTGFITDATPVNKLSEELLSISNNRVLRVANPGAAEYAKEMAINIQEMKKWTASEIQDFITGKNAELKAFYRNPQYGLAGKTNVDALVVNRANSLVDDMIEKTLGRGSEYDLLRKEYGSLAELEKEVAKRTIVDLRKSNKGLVDYSDMLSGAEVVRSILTQSPEAFATGATIKGISRYIKYLNDPNRIVDKMFKSVDEAFGLQKQDLSLKALPAPATRLPAPSPKDTSGALPQSEVIERLRQRGIPDEALYQNKLPPKTEAEILDQKQRLYQKGPYTPKESKPILYNGSGGKITTRKNDFENVLTIETSQMEVLKRLAQAGNKRAKAVLENPVLRRDFFRYGDPVIRQALGGQYEAIKYLNKDIPSKGIEYHDLKANKFYSEKKATAEVYSMMSRSEKYKKP